MRGPRAGPRLGGFKRGGPISRYDQPRGGAAAAAAAALRAQPQAAGSLRKRHASFERLKNPRLVARCHDANKKCVVTDQAREGAKVDRPIDPDWRRNATKAFTLQRNGGLQP